MTALAIVTSRLRVEEKLRLAEFARRGAEVEREEALKMHEKGIPVYPTPERGVRALGQFFAHDDVKLARIETHKKDEAHDEGPRLRLMPGPAAVRVLRSYRIPAVTSAPAKNAAEAVKLAERRLADINAAWEEISNRRAA